MIEELIRDKTGNLLLYLPGLGDGSQVTSSHQQTSDQLPLLHAGPVDTATGQHVECVHSVLEVDGQVSGQDGLLYQ